MAAAAVIWALQNQHLDEAGWLLEATLRALDSPLLSLAEVASGPERRMLSHIDALIVGGPEVATELLVPELLEGCFQARIAAATLALLYADDPRGHHLVLEALDDEQLSSRCREGLALGLARCIRSGTLEWLAAGLGRSPLAGVIGRLHCFAGHRLDLGSHLRPLLCQDDPQLLCAAAWLVRCCSDPAACRELPRLVQHADIEVQRAAIESGLILHQPGAIARMVELAAGDGPLRRAALTWLALVGDARVHAGMIARLEHEPTRADLLWALGFTGRPAAVDAALPFLADDQLGALAAEIVCAIAGLSPVAEDGAERYWQDRPPIPDVPAFEDDDLDAELEPTGDDLLPRPQPEFVAEWWHDRRAQFDDGGRYRLGHRPVRVDQRRQRHLRGRRRHGARVRP